MIVGGDIKHNMVDIMHDIKRGVEVPRRQGVRFDFREVKEISCHVSHNAARHLENEVPGRFPILFLFLFYFFPLQCHKLL
jgi:hypothetical protein